MLLYFQKLKMTQFTNLVNKVNWNFQVKKQPRSAKIRPDTFFVTLLRIIIIIKINYNLTTHQI